MIFHTNTAASMREQIKLRERNCVCPTEYGLAGGFAMRGKRGAN